MAFKISELLANKELPNDWSIGLVGDIAKVNATSITKKFSPKTIRYLDISSVGTRFFDKPKVLEYSEAPSRAQRVVKDGDTLISTVRPNLRAFTYINNAGENLIASTGFACVTANDKNDSLYLHYYLTCESFIQHLIRFADGAAYPAFDYKLIPLAEIPLPSPVERKNIGQFLGALDERIALLRETNATLEAIAQELFKSWFVDFDPVRAKSEGKLPEGMDEATAALFPDTFEEAELGLVPKGWEVESLDDVAKFLNGLALQKFPPTGVNDLPVIKIAQLRKGDTIGADLAAGSIKPDYVIQNGDVLFSWSGSLEVEIWCGGVGALNQHLFKVSSSRFDKWFYYLWTKHHLESFRQIAASKATTMGHIQRGHLSSAKVNVPNESVLKVANALFTPLVERIVHNALQANTLANLRDTLLPRLISGQLRIADVDAELEKVTA